MISAIIHGPKSVLNCNAGQKTQKKTRRQWSGLCYVGV